MGARGWPAAVAAAVLAVLAAGCEFRATVDVDLEADGGGKFAVTVEADEVLAARAGDQRVDPFDELVDVGRALAPGWETDARRTEGGGRAVTLATPFDDPAELEQVSSALAEALSAPELDPLDGFSVAVDREEIRIAGRAGLEPTDAVADFGLDPPSAAALLEDTVDYRVALRMAGEIRETNAHGERNGELTWKVPAGRSVDIVAVAARPRRPWARIGAVAGAVALAGALAVAWRRRSRRRMPQRG